MGMCCMYQPVETRPKRENTIVVDSYAEGQGSVALVPVTYGARYLQVDVLCQPPGAMPQREEAIVVDSYTEGQGIPSVTCGPL